jgi:arylsulfatase A-like enzyme
MRLRLRVTSGVALWVVALVPALSWGAGRPNILFIAVDDLRPQLGCYGDAVVKSPNIDALAKQSVRFDRAYCQLALCNPSRASLLSGRRPEHLGVYDLKTFLRDKNPDVVTLPQLFKQNGYTTRSFGKIFHTGNGNHDDPASWSEKSYHPGKTAAGPTHGQEKADPDSEDPHADELAYAAPDCADEDLPDGQVATHAVEAMRGLKGKPFFLAVGFYRPHLSYVAPKRYWDLYRPEEIKLATNPKLPAGAPAFASNNASELRRYAKIPKKGPIPDETARALVHGYDASVSYVDAQVGKVLAELDRQGLRDNTIIILWGDHGYQLGEHGTWTKRTNWEIATRVPLLVSVPAGVSERAKRGAVAAGIVEFVDVYPTLADLCGLPLPPKLDGKSFAPLLADPSGKGKDAAFSIYRKSVPELGGTSFGRAIVTERYRLIEWSPKDRSRSVYELYDHRYDPGENTNVADLPENKGVVAELVGKLRAEERAGKK